MRCNIASLPSLTTFLVFLPESFSSNHLLPSMLLKQDLHGFIKIAVRVTVGYDMLTFSLKPMLEILRLRVFEAKKSKRAHIRSRHLEQKQQSWTFNRIKALLTRKPVLCNQFYDCEPIGQRRPDLAGIKYCPI